MEIQEREINSKLVEKNSQLSQLSDKTPRTAHDINPEKIRDKLGNSKTTDSKTKRELISPKLVRKIKEAEKLGDKCEKNLVGLKLKLEKFPPTDYQNQKMIMIKKRILDVKELYSISNAQNIEDLINYCDKLTKDLNHFVKWIKLMEIELDNGPSKRPSSKLNYLLDEKEELEKNIISDTDINQRQNFIEYFLERLFCGPENEDDVEEDILVDLLNSRLSMVPLIVMGAWIMNHIFA